MTTEPTSDLVGSQVGCAGDAGRSQPWPTPAMVRVAALAARVLDVDASMLTVARAGGQSPLVTVVVDRDGATAEPVRSGRIQVSGEVPLVDSSGGSLGRLAVLSRAARSLRAYEFATLRDFGRILGDEIELDGEARSERATSLQRVEIELQAQEVAAVAAAVRSLSALEDPGGVRRAIGEIALQITGADSCAILDVVGDDMHLVQSLSAGSPWRLPITSLSDETAHAATAYTAGKAVLVADPREAEGDEGRRTHRFTLWQPFAAGGRSSVAVLALAWGGPLTVRPPRLTDITELLATEATSLLERADLLAQLAGLARTDELTGLPNRRAIHEDLAREMERARRQGTALCVSVLDLDRFKSFNDTQGHPAGDDLLVEVATAWRDALRAGSDSIGRYGGEEFLAVLPASPDEALATVERLRRLTPKHQTASAGIANWDGTESADAVVARADVALYAAKARGRDRAEMADAPATGRLTRKRMVGVFGAAGAERSADEGTRVDA